MEIVLLDQTRAFIWSAALGIALGALYDLRGFWVSLFRKKALEPLLDILYCIAFMGGFLAVTQLTSQGNIRWYIPGGLGLGMSAYFCGFSDYIRMMLSFIEVALKWIWRRLKKLLQILEKIWSKPSGY